MPGHLAFQASQREMCVDPLPRFPSEAGDLGTGDAGLIGHLKNASQERLYVCKCPCEQSPVLLVDTGRRIYRPHDTPCYISELFCISVFLLKYFIDDFIK